MRPCPVPLVERPEYKEGEQVEVGVLNVADVCSDSKWYIQVKNDVDYYEAITKSNCFKGRQYRVMPTIY